MDQKLPYEILHIVMEYATNETLVSCTLVNRSWYQLAAHNSLWKDQKRFKHNYGNTNHQPIDNYRKFISETKKKAFKQNAQLLRQAKQKVILIKIGLAILAVFCPIIAGFIANNKQDDDQDLALESFIYVALIFLGTCCFWIPGVIVAWIYIYNFPLKHSQLYLNP